VNILSGNDFFNNLYNEYRVSVATIIKNKIYSNRFQDIEDCVQEVFLRAWENVNLESHPCIKGCIYKTANHVALQFNEKFKSHDNVLFIIDDEEVKLVIKSDDFSDQLIEDIEYERYIEENSIEKVMKRFNKSISIIIIKQSN